MPSITTWMRIEPQNRSRDLPGLAARVHDPLWMLGRQWQLGEWDGEDAASPVSANLVTEEVPLTAYIPQAVVQGANAAVPYPGKTPLETIVEREAIAPVQSSNSRDMALSISAAAGLDFLALVAASAGTAKEWLSQFPMPKPSKADADAWPADDVATWRLLCAGSIPDGRAIYESLRSGAPTGPLPDMPKQQLLDGWFAAYRPFFEPGATPAWNAERLKYEFGVSAHLSSGEIVLAANDYDGVSLDWWSFDIAEAATNMASSPGSVSAVAPMCIPVPVTFPGMPVSRFWEFEDAKISLASVDAERTDLARILFLEFALTFGNDFFLIPHALPVGSICRTSSLSVDDAFGERTVIPPPDATWTLFQLSGSGSAGAASNLLFLPPVVAKELAGPAREEVRLARDEMANIVWGFEKLVTNPLGRPVRRTELYQEKYPRDATPPNTSADASLRYRLASDVPDYWVPFVPVPDASGMFFEYAGLVRPLGKLIDAGMRVREEDIPRDGVELSRRFALARWTDGSTHLWLGRRRGVGTGEASSGLKFDKSE